MTACRAVLVLFLGLALLVGAPLCAGEPRLTRIFHLHGMETHEAVTLLRSRLQVRQMAEIRDLDLVVVAEVADKIEDAEALLHKQGALAATIEPHPPVSLDRSGDQPLETRVFRIEGIEARAAITVLRAIYQIRKIEELDGENGLSVQASVPKLDAAEALLTELEVLVAEP